jgi:hypothetical protein
MMSEVIRGGLSGIAHGSLKGSYFDVGEWDLYDWEMLLAQHPQLIDLTRKARAFGVDARDVFMAVSGKDVVGDDPIAESWRSLLKTPSWKSAIGKAKTELNRYAFIKHMLEGMLVGPASSNDPFVGILNQAGEGDEGDEVGDGQIEKLFVIPSAGQAEEAAMFVAFLDSIRSDLDGDKRERVDEAMALASLIDLREFSSILGFCSRIVRGASRKSDDASQEMTGYEHNGWSDKVVPHDMLAVAEGETHALIRLAENQLTVRTYHGERAMGKGPVILLRDETFSMTQYERHRQALSLEIALAQAMNKDGRDLISIAWGGNMTRTHIWGSDGLSDHLSSFISGNFTALGLSLHKALKAADEYVSGADILILTDGHVHDSETMKNDSDLQESLNEYNDHGGRVWAVVIGDLDRDLWAESLPVCDGVISSKDLLASDDLGKMLESIAHREPEGARKRALV